jgi:trk system potassium uptake protein TrkA
LNIIIIGAGKVGFTLAAQLSREKHNVTIIDKNDDALRRAGDALDVMAIRGSGASPSVLKQAGVASADFLLAATSFDEVNMLCSLVAKRLGAKYTVARIRDVEYTANLSSFQRDLDIDMVINPEYATAIEISHLIRFPPAANIDTFFRGRVELISTSVQAGDFLIGRSLASLSPKLQKLPLLFCAAERAEIPIIPNGNYVPQLGDKLYIIGTPKGLHEFFHLLGRYVPKVHSVFIVGGSRIAIYLAAMLEREMRIPVTIIESDAARCRHLSETLPKAQILQGDGTDQEVLATEHFTKHDAFVALTGRDEDNLLIALYARQQGLKKVIAKSNRDNYTDIGNSAGLESILSPKIITASRILRTIRELDNKKGNIMTSLYRFADSGIEAAEFKISETARNLNTPLKDLSLKPGILIAAISHDGKVLIPNGASAFTLRDRVILVYYDQTILDFNDIFL